MNDGTAYGRPRPSFLSELTRVGPGTPMGELQRRYWHPVAMARDAGPEPRQIRVLGEDLILFRDGAGRPGLFYPRCAHRGTSLLYGRTEERGLRCCYHGWLFDVSGHCLEQPCEPAGGSARDRVRQPWYPVEERYGLIFAYLGPSDRRPVLPRYEILENPAPGEFIEADDSSIGSGGPAIVPCNWLQHFENVMDPFHVPVLHASFSGGQFTERMAVMPRVAFQPTGRGVRSVQLRDLPGGTHRRITEAILPTIRAVPNPRAETDGPCSLIGWVLPMDDTSFRIYSAGRVTEPGALAAIRSRFGGRPWSELSEAEHRRFPGDYEAQVGQGRITLHSEEHLATSDQGIVMLRRALRSAVEAVARGEDPAGVLRDPDAAPIRLDAGTELVPAPAARPE